MRDSYGIQYLQIIRVDATIRGMPVMINVKYHNPRWISVTCLSYPPTTELNVTATLKGKPLEFNQATVLRHAKAFVKKFG